MPFDDHQQCEKYFFDRFCSKLAGIFVRSIADNRLSFITIGYKMAVLAAILFWYPNHSVWNRLF